MKTTAEHGDWHVLFKCKGVELGPLEIQINSLQKSIEAEQQEIVELQQMWLRDQSELVSLAKTKDGESVDVENLKKQLTILSQKKLRIESECLDYLNPKFPSKAWQHKS